MNNQTSKRLKILVMGASGQLARSLADTASACDILTLVPMGRPENDILDPASVARAVDTMRPQIIINAAAYTAVDNAEAQPDLAFATNRDAAGTVAGIAASHGIPVIQISTDYVFDGKKKSAYVETDAPNPQSIYGRSKYEGEIRVAETNPQHIILRTSWVYSKYGSNFVKTMLRLSNERQELRVVADQYGNPTYAGDLASAIIGMITQLSDKSESVWGVYHFAGQGETSWHGFAEQIFATSQHCGRPPVRVQPITTADFPTAAKRPANSCLDCSKAMAVFGIALPHWKESITQCVAHLSNEEGC